MRRAHDFDRRVFTAQAACDAAAIAKDTEENRVETARVVEKNRADTASAALSNLDWAALNVLNAKTGEFVGDGW